MYRRAGLLVAVGLMMLVIPACSVGPAQNTLLFKQWNAKCQEAADMLEAIKDVPTAKASAPKLKTVMQELAKIDEKLEASYDPSEVDFVDESRVTKQVAEGIVQMQRVIVESLRIGKDPQMRAALGEAWQYLPAAAMMDAQGNFLETE
ncbi:MAG: hypothetical protein L0211_01265 [Planctomycetaceae bacterium]|nr:hypothetical protein [Planctomycetaceae bacterium]